MVCACWDVSHPASLALARQAVTGPGTRQALPLLALHKTQLAAAGPPRGPSGDASAVLDAKLASEADRAWAVYVERGMQLQRGGQGAAARAVMEQGMVFFRTAGEAWPQAILFTGQNQGWDQAELERSNKQKIDSIFEKMKKKI